MAYTRIFEIPISFLAKSPDSLIFTIDLLDTIPNTTATDNPRSVAVNHAGLWIRRHQFESGRGYSSKNVDDIFGHRLRMKVAKAAFMPAPSILYLYTKFQTIVKAINIRLRIYLAILAAVVIVGVLGLMAIEGFTPLDSFYFIIVTIATVGYGDIHPITPSQEKYW